MGMDDASFSQTVPYVEPVVKHLLVMSSRLLLIFKCIDWYPDYFQVMHSQRKRTDGIELKVSNSLSDSYETFIKSWVRR